MAAWLSLLLPDEHLSIGPYKPKNCSKQLLPKGRSFIVIVTSLCGADDWSVIETLAISIKDWIARFVDVSSGIPSAHTIERVFSLVSPEQMEQTLIEIMELLKEKKETVISFDGKTLKGTLDEQAGKRAVHLKSRGRVEKRLYYSMDADELPDKMEWSVPWSNPEQPKSRKK